MIISFCYVMDRADLVRSLTSFEYELWFDLTAIEEALILLQMDWLVQWLKPVNGLNFNARLLLDISLRVNH